MLLSQVQKNLLKSEKKLEGDTIMIVEAMKTMNHVPSTLDGIERNSCFRWSTSRIGQFYYFGIMFKKF